MPFPTDAVQAVLGYAVAFVMATGGVVNLAGPAGIRAAFTTERGVNDLRNGDWLRLGRINVAVGTPSSLILAQAVR